MEKYEESEITKRAFTRISEILKTGDSDYIRNPFLEDIEIRFGNKKEGLTHIILRRIEERTHRTVERLSFEQAAKETSILLYLIMEAVQKGKTEFTSRGNWNAELHGIKAIITKDIDGNYVLTGFDNKQKKEESAEAIKAGIARYGTTPEFLDMYAQVGAVYSSYNQDISDLEKKQVKNVKHAKNRQDENRPER